MREGGRETKAKTLGLTGREHCLRDRTYLARPRH